MNKEKEEVYIKKLFNKMASHYNFTTIVLTLGIFPLIQNYMLRKSNLKTGDNVIDICCGTGKLSLKIAKRVGDGGKVVGIDFSSKMLDVGRLMMKNKSIKNVEFIEGNALDLPFSNNNFEIAINSFALRNVLNIKKSIEEMSRVVKSGGQVVCLEAAIPTNKILLQGFNLIFFKIIPFFAKIINKVKDNDKYFDYLWLIKSFKEFPSQTEIKNMYINAGLVEVKSFSLIGGLFTVYLGQKR
ncbi:demethylmenaquinone methyltransferase / 2-methoxy-6-polyprenyl-1,4-benzoquinol methylase [Desulfonispora thiosulfatigenes DSM 11270]|uniref:Demethylmenaquinone methyltransferase n=1 Tax=Desulfonispora thiosulfatigenes DSM 11270 TaxID=656914 RepID=A0A1W1VGZ8_DESTI|nr:ubiquinone/menaquinone biosynthesis methyltransferase [Desulfonispora thiosulfatigenes]SMB92638.1 demethylmenaquinone methyltransferase / 2-methoxy-6-polyprenyl-1,4-benzoquinol methylase [Desulfonispora thiosulfatigenes DSM 11270]